MPMNASVRSVRGSVCRRLPAHSSNVRTAKHWLAPPVDSDSHVTERSLVMIKKFKERIRMKANTNKEKRHHYSGGKARRASRRGLIIVVKVVALGKLNGGSCGR